MAARHCIFDLTDLSPYAVAKLGPPPHALSDAVLRLHTCASQLDAARLPANWALCAHSCLIDVASFAREPMEETSDTRDEELAFLHERLEPIS